MHQSIGKIQSFEVDNVSRVDFHLHTNWTDGKCAAIDMYNSAVSKNLTEILFSEHGRKTSGDWFPKFADEIRDLPKEKCRAFVGLEAKIRDFEGNIDTTSEILACCDMVMAVVHRFPEEKDRVRNFDEVDPMTAVETEIELSLAVLDNPDVDILGHPLGMSLRRFKVQPTDEQFLRIIEKAAKTKVAFEINSYYHRDPWKLIRLCREKGALISLGSNAHDLDSVGRIVKLLEEAECIK